MTMPYKASWNVRKWHYSVFFYLIYFNCAIWSKYSKILNILRHLKYLRHLDYLCKYRSRPFNAISQSKTKNDFEQNNEIIF